MSGLGPLFNVPGSSEELNEWSFAHMSDHRNIIKSVQREFDVTLPEYALDPAPVSDLNAWIYQHQQMHNDVNQLIGISGLNLTNVNWQEPNSRAGWIFANASEHAQIGDILRIGVPVIPTPTVTTTFRSAATLTSSTATFNFGTMSFGSAFDGRRMVGCFSWQGAGNPLFSSCSIGGISSSLLVQAGPDGGGRHTAIVLAEVPTGSSGNVTLGLNAGCLNASAALYSVEGAESASLVAWNISTSPTASLTVNAFGSIVGIACGGGPSSPSGSWTNITEDVDSNYGAGGLQCRSAAHRNFTEYNQNLSVRCVLSGATAGVGSFAVFNP